jgi:hypothetical protein
MLLFAGLGLYWSVLVSVLTLLHGLGLGFGKPGIGLDKAGLGLGLSTTGLE